MASTLEALLLAQTNFLANPPQLIGTQNTAQPALTTGTFTKIVIDTITSDPYGWWDAVNNRWVPKIPGTYEVTATTCWPTNATGARAASIYLNGVPVPGGTVEDPGSSSNATVPSVTWPVICNGSTDYLELWGMQTSGAAMATYTDTQIRSALSVRLVHL